MKKRYQMDRESAVRGFRKQAEESEQELQLHLPLKEVAAALQEGVGHLMRQAGLELMQLIMDNEVRSTAGERYQRREAEQPFRWGREKGFLVVDGQKVPIKRPRLRSEAGRERSFRARQPGKVGWTVGASARQAQTLRAVYRRHRVQGPTSDRCAGNQYRRDEDGSRAASGSERERDSCG